VADLVAAGRRGDAIIHFNRSIGVPEEMIEGLQDAPAWPALEALAHTLVYDLTIASSFTPYMLPGIATPTLVVTSEATDDRLRRWARTVAEAMPDPTIAAPRRVARRRPGGPRARPGGVPHRRVGRVPQHLIAGGRPAALREPRPQERTRTQRSYSTMATSLPLACPSPRYRSASGTSRNR
jgi:hypothetical protein